MRTITNPAVAGPATRHLDPARKCHVPVWLAPALSAIGVVGLMCAIGDILF